MLSIFALKREINRVQYWVSIAGVCVLFYAAYLAVLPSLYVDVDITLPEWRKNIATGLFAFAMLLWMRTLARRYYMVQRSPIFGLIAVFIPFANVLVTLFLGLGESTRPGNKEKPFPQSGYTLLAGLIVIYFGYLFFMADAFEGTRTLIKQILSGIVVLLVIGYLSKIKSSSSSSSTVKKSSNDGLFSRKKDEPNTAPSQKQEKKYVGVYIVNEGGYQNNKIRVYSDGHSFTASSNLKEIKAQSFKALEPLIYDSFKDDKRFKMIDSQEF